MVYEYEGYKIYVSTRPDKKYMAKVDNKTIHFGSRFNSQFHDKLGHYRSQDNNDENKRKAYRARHSKLSDNYKVKGTSAWFSWNILW